MAAYLVEHQGLGYLSMRSIDSDNNGNISLREEIAIVLNPNDGCRLIRNKAEDIAAKLNKREMHKKWKATAWAVVYPEWQKSQKKGKGT